MLVRLWLLVTFLLTCHAASLFMRTGIKRTPNDTASMTNAQRIKRGLPLKKPAMRGTPPRAALAPRASVAGGGQTDAVMTATDTTRKRATLGYVGIDSSTNRLVIVPDLESALSLFVPANPSGMSEIEIATNADARYYIGAASSGSAGYFDIRGVSVSDGRNPEAAAVQTSIWTLLAPPTGLTGSFFALGGSSSLSLYLDGNNHIAATTNPANIPVGRGLSLALDASSSLSKSTRLITPPTEDTSGSGSNSDPQLQDPNVDKDLNDADKQLNNGAALDEEALLKFLSCVDGPGKGTPECDAFLAGLEPPTP